MHGAGAGVDAQEIAVHPCERHEIREEGVGLKSSVGGAFNGAIAEQARTLVPNLNRRFAISEDIVQREKRETVEQPQQPFVGNSVDQGVQLD